MEEQEWKDFVDRTWPLFYGQALNILRKPSDAEDVVQDTYYNILKAGYPLKEAGFIGPTIIKNICTNLTQRNKLVYGKNKLIQASTLNTRQTYENVPLPIAKVIGFSDHCNNIHIHDMDMEYILREIKNRLTEKQYMMLMLLVKGYSYKELSKKFSININTVKATIHQARQHIKHLKQRII